MKPSPQLPSQAGIPVEGAESRRAFLTRISGAAVLAAGGCTAIHGDKTALAIIDTHTHFYDPSRPKGVPWPPKDDAFLYRPVLPTELKGIARPLGVRGTVVVEASPLEDDNQWVLDLAAREPFIVGLVGHLKPGRPNFQDYLAWYRRNPRFLGIRTGLWGIRMSEDPPVVQDLRALAEDGLMVDLLINTDQLTSAARLARQVPDLRIVIDHSANLSIDGKTPPAQWTDGIRELALAPNVHMKVSGLVEGTGRRDGTAPKDVGYYRPVLDTLWRAFGPDRLIFGSNWPVSARFASYETVLGIVREYFEGQGADAARRFFSGNAARVYRHARPQA